MATASRERIFVEQANPHQWLLVASNLHDQAVEAWRRFGLSRMAQVDGNDRVIAAWDGANRTTFLLCGFAIENALKAFLVYENPSWISNGRLCRELKTHELVALSRSSSTVPSAPHFTEVLERFESGLESWARYPCALSMDDTEPEAVLTANDWNGYSRLMEAYGSRLCEFLSSRLWRGPHGFAGRWTFQGEFLGAKVNFA